MVLWKYVRHRRVVILVVKRGEHIKRMRRARNASASVQVKQIRQQLGLLVSPRTGDAETQ